MFGENGERERRTHTHTLSLLPDVGVERKGGGEMLEQQAVIGQSKKDGLLSDWLFVFAGQKVVSCRAECFEF